MFHGKFSIGLLLLTLSVSTLYGQWRTGLMPSDAEEAAMTTRSCSDIMLTVKDTDGREIIGAAVVTEETPIPSRTDSDGLVKVRCAMGGLPPIAQISASGFRTVRMMLVPDARSNLIITMNRHETNLPAAGSTVTAAELAGNVQETTAELHDKARKALARKDYTSAETLLLEALHLAPSSPSIANDLGVIALHKRDLDSAGSWFGKAADAAPRKPAFLGNLGLVRWMQHRAEESYEILNRACSMGYESGLAHYILGIVNLAKGNGPVASDHLKRVSAAQFPYRDLYLSVALHKSGKTKAADRSYRNFLRRNPASFLSDTLSTQVQI